MVQASEFGAVVTSLSDLKQARRIARLLVREKLAACVQLLDMESHYVWKGKTVAEPEVMLLAKTRMRLVARAIARIKALHPYEVPEIVAWPFSAGFAPYLAWIAQQTRQPPMPKKLATRR